MMSKSAEVSSACLPSDNEKTCPVCNGLTHAVVIEPKDLIESSTRCSVCAMMRKIVSSLYPDIGIRSKIEKLLLAEDLFSLGALVQFPGLHADRFTVYTTGIDTDMVSSRDSNLPKIIRPQNHVQADASSPLCLNLIKKWYEECTSTHDRCSSAASLTLPTRLVAIEGGAFDWKVRLIEHLTTPIQYAALSHRWSSNVLKTTATNLASMLQDIPRSELSKTFQDAVLICIYLGISHLWIDSLCIVQQCARDWELESARMADTYQNACLVIAASAATDGILVPRSNNIIRSCIFEDVHRPIEVFVRPKISHGQPVPPAHQDLLSTRGWTMQERMLAHRFLSFTSTEVQWECESFLDCECSSPRGGARRQDQHSYDLNHMLRGDVRTVYGYWSKIIQTYSSRRLTVDSDKLPAISAMAKRFHTRLGTQYLAGLWAGSLLHGLIWRRGWQYDRVHIPPDYRAPSWSWASINCDILTLSPLSSEEAVREPAIATVVDVQCDPSTADDFGQVKSGFVVLRGPLTEGLVYIPADDVLPYRSVRLYNQDQEVLQEDYEFLLDTPLQSIKDANANGKYQQVLRRTNFSYHISGPEELTSYAGQPDEVCRSSLPRDFAKVWLLRLLKRDVLVLGKSEDSPDQFVRLGIYTNYRGHAECDHIFRDSVSTTVTVV